MSNYQPFYCIGCRHRLALYDKLYCLPCERINSAKIRTWARGPGSNWQRRQIAALAGTDENKAKIREEGEQNG